MNIIYSPETKGINKLVVKTKIIIELLKNKIINFKQLIS